MSLQLLPCELIFHILDFIPTERYYQDTIDDINDDGIEEAIKCGLISSQDQYENMVRFITEYGEGMYYAYPMIYATSKTFAHLCDLEYLCSDNGEFHSNLVSRDINGKYNGIMLSGCGEDRISGYAYYDNNDLVYENILHTDIHYFYRDINGKRYRAINGWHNDCDPATCKSCAQINVIENEIFTRDPFLKTLLNKDDGNIVAREKRTIFRDANFVYEHDLEHEVE